MRDQLFDPCADLALLEENCKSIITIPHRPPVKAVSDSHGAESAIST